MGAWKEGERTPILKARGWRFVGGGNVAMDASRSASGGRQGGTSVPPQCREIPARAEEWSTPRRKADIQASHNPKEVLGNDHGYVRGMRVAVRAGRAG